MKKILLSAYYIITWSVVRLLQLLHLKSSNNIPSSSGSTFQTFTILKGQHDCEQKYFRPLTTYEMNFVVKFDESAIYTLSNTTDQYDTNKLWGFSDGWNHLENSARIGWNYTDGSIRLHAFAHVAGKMIYEQLTIVQAGEEVHCKIKIYGRYYLFTAKDQTLAIPRVTKKLYADGYQLFPYFGGNQVAPQQITIQIK